MKALLLAAAAMLAAHEAAYAQDRSDEWLRRPVDDRTFHTFRTFFTYDRNVPFEATTLDTAVVDGVFVEHLSFTSTPGQRVFAHLHEPATLRGKPLRSLVMLHGGVAVGKANMRVIADFMARSGWRVLAIDMQHFGERRSGLLEAFTEAEKHDKLYNQPSTYLAWITQNAKDVGRAIDFLVRERAADSARIGLVGYSRGAQVGMIVGAVERRFRAVVLAYGGHFDARETGHLAAACPANYIGRISPRPVFLLNGTQDADYHREDQVEPLHRLARNPKRVMWLETGHIYPPEATRPVTARWLAESIP